MTTIKTTQYTLSIALSACCVAAVAGPQDAQALRVYSNLHCGIQFEYPVGFIVQNLPAPEMDGEFWTKFGRCGIRVTRAGAEPAARAIRISVVNAPLISALESDSNWSRAEEHDNTLWTRQGHSSGHGKLMRIGALTLVLAEYSLNCGTGRSPGQAMSCDAIAGGISNEAVTALVDSSLSGEPDAAAAMLRSIKFK